MPNKVEGESPYAPTCRDIRDPSPLAGILRRSLLVIDLFLFYVNHTPVNKCVLKVLLFFKMIDQSAILFFHKGKIPNFLRCTIESARFFNPSTRIILMADTRHDFGSLKVEVREIDRMIHPQFQKFLDSYVHISGIKVYYERLFLERWFHLEQLLQEEKIGQALYLDSDSMLFSSVESLFAEIPDVNFCTSRAGGPACTFIRRSLDPFLNFVLAKYQDREFLDSWKKRSDAAIAKGGLDNLGDMSFIELFTTTQSAGAIYPNDLTLGHIDHCIHVPDGMESRKKRRHRFRKKIFWKNEEGKFIPYFRRLSDGQEVKALAVHFQSGAKRKIRRFNRIGDPSLFPPAWRLAYFNHLLN